MKYKHLFIITLAGLFPLSLLGGCVDKRADSSAQVPSVEKIAQQETTVLEKANSSTLPLRYQQPFYLVDSAAKNEDLGGKADEYEIKVGANITSTKGPQPLWDIMKKLASMQQMSVSWAGDVNRDVLVDVNIRATDGYFEAIDNLLRQVDYFHEVQGTTIIIRYKDSKQYHVTMPFTKQLYEAGTGGNVLGGEESASTVEGTIRLDSKGNEFDIWKNIETNLNTIITTWSNNKLLEIDQKKKQAQYQAEMESKTLKETTSAEGSAKEDLKSDEDKERGAVDVEKFADTQAKEATKTAQLRVIAGNSYTIDKPVGIISVHAPRPLQEKIAAYLETIERELYKQITIEAKIIEVQLNDSSSLGLDWNLLLNNLSAAGGLTFSKDYDKGKTNSKENTKTNSRTITSNTGRSSESTDTDDGTTSTSASTSTLSRSLQDAITLTDLATTSAATLITSGAGNLASGTISLATLNFGEFINALSKQGNTSILSNPKLSVMNGQPALITVGKNQTYISSIEVDRTAGTITTAGTLSYSVKTDRVLSGVGLALTGVIRGEDEIIMNLTPVTSQLQGEIEYRAVGEGQVGLPLVNIREMNTMVKVKSGEMLVIGGLIDNYETKEGSFLFPGVDKLPGLKYLFGHDSTVTAKRELIILLKPHIM